MITLLVAIPVASAQAAIIFGQIDEFETPNDTLGWVHGKAGTGPNQMPDDGPNGLGDGYLDNFSNGDFEEPGGRPNVFNRSQWTGNYTAAGVTAIRLDFHNLGHLLGGPGGADLNVRLAFEGAGGAFATTTAFPIASNTGWQTITFNITPGHLTSVDGASTGIGFDAAATLADVSELRILSSVAIAFRGDPLLARFGVDNITAIPEPSTWALSLLGLLLCWRFFPRRRAGTA